jgi:hypothetical protein
VSKDANIFERVVGARRVHRLSELTRICENGQRGCIDSPSESVQYQYYTKFFTNFKQKVGGDDEFFTRAAGDAETYRVDDDVQHEGHEEREGPRRKPTTENAEDTERRRRRNGRGCTWMDADFL